MDPLGEPFAVRVVTRRDRLVDALVAAALLVGATVSLLLSIDPAVPLPPVWAIVAWGIAITVPLALRRMLPSVVAGIAVPAFLVGQSIGVPEHVVSQIAPFLAIYSVGAWSTDRRRALVVRIGLTVLVAVWFVGEVATLGRGPLTAVSVPLASILTLNVLTTLLYLAAAIAFGETAWRSAVRRIALEERTAELRAERERTARQAAAVERMRIARDLHDVVAHRVSVIGVQAGAARRVLASSPDAAERALSAVEESARLAIDDLRATVLSLRGPEGADEPVSTLGVAQIDVLVAEARSAGTPVDYRRSGDESAVPAAAALALYRVAQEALTNVRKHAGAGAVAEVRVEVGDRTAELVVADAGGRRPAARAPGTGVGVLGMRERVDAAGGSLEAGRTAEGYRVRAIVPVGS